MIDIDSKSKSGAIFAKKGYYSKDTGSPYGDKYKFNDNSAPINKITYT